MDIPYGQANVTVDTFDTYKQSNQYKTEQARNNSNFMSGLTSASEFFVAGLNSNILMGNFEALENTADQVELQAEQRANQLREKFNKSVGDYTYTATKRGFDVDSGSARQNIEQSAIAMGKDIQMAKDNAKVSANQKRREAENQKRMADVSLISGFAKGFSYMGGIK